MCVNWNEPSVSRLQLYEQPSALKDAWVQAGGCKRRYPKGQSRNCYQECGCHLFLNKIVFKRRNMSRHDLVSAQNLQCLHNSHATLNALAYIVCVKQFVMSLPAISLGDWCSVSRKGGTEGGGLVYTPKGWKQHGCVWVWLKKKSLSRVIVQMVISPHRASMHAVFKTSSAIYLLALPKQLDH